MQLTGDRFTSETAAFGNDLSTLPDFPAEIRAPAGTLPGVSALPAALRRPRHHDAGRRPERARRDEPGRAQGEPQGPAARRDIIVNTDEFTTRNLTKVGYAANPLEDGSLDAYNLHPIAAHLDDGRGAQGLRRHARRRPSARRTCSRSGCSPGCTTGRREGTDRVPRGQVRQEARASSRPTSRPSRPAGTSARPPRTSRSPTRSSRPRMHAGHLPQHHRQPRAVLRPGRRRPAAPGCRCSSAPTRSRRPRTSCTSCASTSASASAPSRPRTRSPASARRSARRSAARSASPPPPGPGIALKSRDDRPGGVASSCRWSSSTSSAAARPPACRPRPSSPTCCRPCSAATARRRCRSSRPRSPADCFDAAIEAVPDRDDVPHAGVPALRRLPRQRLRAVADPGRRRPARPARSSSRPSPTTPTSGTEVFWPYLRDPRDARAAVGRPRHARPRAPHRRHREGRRHRQHLLRPGQPRPHGPDRARPRSTASPRHRRRSRSTTRPGDARVLVLGWGSTYGPIGAGRAARARARAARSPRRTCATSTRSRPTSASAAQLRQGARPRDEPRPARAAPPRPSTSSTRSAYNQVRGLPFKADELAGVIEDVIGS